jgi:UDP-N-acetyl-D-mannosaminuronate dehydrogenase
VDEVEGGLSYRISVVGLGYVGLIHAVGFANLGYRVLGYDVDRVKVEKLGEATRSYTSPAWRSTSLEL